MFRHYRDRQKYASQVLRIWGETIAFSYLLQAEERNLLSSISQNQGPVDLPIPVHALHDAAIYEFVQRCTNLCPERHQSLVVFMQATFPSWGWRSSPSPLPVSHKKSQLEITCWKLHAVRSSARICTNTEWLCDHIPIPNCISLGNLFVMTWVLGSNNLHEPVSEIT